MQCLEYSRTLRKRYHRNRAFCFILQISKLLIVFQWSRVTLYKGELFCAENDSERGGNSRHQKTWNLNKQK